MAFLDEIHEQGRALRDLVSFYRGDGAELLAKFGHTLSGLTRSIVFAGMGTSEFVPGIVRDYIGDKASSPVVMWEAGELLHYGMESVRDNDAVIAISQSGESIETRMVVEGLRYHKNLITVTNNPSSTMARLAVTNVPMVAGEEATISTKTYTNSMGVLLLLSRALALEEWRPVLDDLERVSLEMDEFVASRTDEIRAAADLLKDAHTVYFVSRGPTMVAARQSALTFQEGAHIFTSALPGGSMRHGPFEVVGPGFHAVLLASDGRGGDLVRNMAIEMADLGGKVVLMTSKEVPAHENILSIVLKPGAPELFPLACAAPQELLIDRMASDRGWTAGVFTLGSKITATE